MIDYEYVPEAQAIRLTVVQDEQGYTWWLPATATATATATAFNKGRTK